MRPNFVAVETFENVRREDIMFRKFSGVDTWHPRGGGNVRFGIYLPDDLANALDKKGWKINWTRVDEDNPVARAYLVVTLIYDKGFDPVVTGICDSSVESLTKDNISTLDTKDITTLTFRVRPWVKNNVKYQDEGAPAYLVAMNVYYKEDIMKRQVREALEKLEAEDDEAAPF